MSPLRERAVRAVVLVMFFLSGACGLVYEVVWMRMLTLVFGATAFATAAILASFFAGLALGSLLFGRAADRVRNPLALYAVLELGIGLTAFLMPVLFAGLTDVYVAISRQMEIGFYPLSLIRLGLSFLVLLIPTTLMGGTLPVIVKFFVANKERLGRGVGTLYAVNTFGAVVGTVAAGFFLILFMGVKEAAYLAGFINLGIAGVMFVLSRKAAGARSTQADGEPRAELQAPGGTSGETLSPSLVRLTLWAVGLSGFCALALEVLWTRSLVYYLDNSTHAFTTMLTAFLLGIALGSAIIARFIDKRRAPLVWFGVIEVLIGMSALVAIPILARTPPVLQRMATMSSGALLQWKWTGMRFLTSLTVMLLPTILMGMTVPLVTKIYTRRLSSLGTALGRVYSMNTIGGVVGSVAAGFVLIPSLGVHGSIEFVAGLSVALGGMLVLSDPVLVGRIRVKTALGVAVALVAIGVFRLSGDGVTLSSFRETVDGEHVLSYREGVGSTVKVYRDEKGARYVSIDGFPVAGTSLGLLDAQKLLGNLPLLLSNASGARVNLIGFGAGGASWAALQYDVREVDVVELVPAVIDAAGWFPEVNHGVVDDPRFNVILGDGRNYALVTDRKYDVITVDATSPKMAGNGSLYTLEFYELLRDRLTEDGMVAQWLPFHLLSEAEMRMTAETFMRVFPHTTLWLSPIRHHALLVGTPERLRIDVAALSRKLERSGVRQELEPMGVRDAMDILGSFVMGEERLAQYTGEARLNTDDHPYLEFTPALSYFFTIRYVTRNLYALTNARESVFPLLVNTGETDEAVAELRARVERRYRASQHTLGGDILFYLGKAEEARAEYAEALHIDPDEKNWAHAVWQGAAAPAVRR